MLLQQMAQLAVQNHHDKSGFDTNFLIEWYCSTMKVFNPDSIVHRRKTFWVFLKQSAFYRSSNAPFFQA